MSEIVKSVKLSQLKFDDKLLELRVLNSHVVSQYRQAMREGAQFPKMIVDKRTGKVVSGNHRLTAYLAEFPSSTIVEVVYRAFKTKADILRCFVEENATHGHPMDTFTKRKLALAMFEEGMSKAEVAKSFGVSEKQVEKYGNHFVVVPGEKGKLEIKPVKTGLDIVPGSQVSKEQYKEHAKKDLGMSAKSLADQLVRWLRNGWISFEDVRVEESFDVLYAELGKALKAKKAS